MTTRDLQDGEFNEYYAHYVNQVSEERDLLTALRKGQEETVSFSKSYPKINGIIPMVRENGRLKRYYYI